MTERTDPAPADLRAEFFRLDKSLSDALPDAFFAGAHLPLLYRFAHPKLRLHEMWAFRLVRDSRDLPLCTDTVLRLYRAMTDGTELEGKGYKTENCCIESADFVYIPTPADQTVETVNLLCEKYGYLNDPGAEDLDGIFRFLLEFICIHPMEDGNGRLSVFLVQLLLKKAGLACAPFLPYDFLQNLMYRGVYQKHIVKASGIFYGQKPLEYGPFVQFTEGLLLKPTGSSPKPPTPESSRSDGAQACLLPFSVDRKAYSMV